MPFGRVAIWRDGERRLPLYICRLMIYQVRSSPFSAMAPIAMVVALCCAAFAATATATADTKPCRTPCLSAGVPREAVPPTAERPAARPAGPKPAAATRPRPQAVAVAAQPAPLPVPEVEKPAAPKKPPLSRRCSEINMRAAVGEPLSEEDMKILRSQC